MARQQRQTPEVKHRLLTTPLPQRAGRATTGGVYRTLARLKSTRAEPISGRDNIERVFQRRIKHIEEDVNDGLLDPHFARCFLVAEGVVRDNLIYQDSLQNAQRGDARRLHFQPIDNPDDIDEFKILMRLLGKSTSDGKSDKDYQSGGGGNNTDAKEGRRRSDRGPLVSSETPKPHTKHTTNSNGRSSHHTSTNRHVNSNGTRTTQHPIYNVDDDATEPESDSDDRLALPPLGSFTPQQKQPELTDTTGSSTPESTAPETPPNESIWKPLTKAIAPLTPSKTRPQLPLLPELQYNKKDLIRLIVTSRMPSSIKRQLAARAVQKMTQGRSTRAASRAAVDRSARS